MATLISVEEIRGRSGQTTISTDSVTSTEIRKYRVYFSSTDATSDEAKNATGVPSYYDAIGGKKLLEKSAEADNEDPKIWLVTCNYSVPQNKDDGSGEGDTAKRNIRISGGSVPYEIETHRDWSGKTLATSAGEWFTGLKFTLYDERMTIAYDTVEPDWENIVGQCGMVHNAELTITINGQTRTFPDGSILYESYSYDATVIPNTGGTITKATSVTLNFRIRNSLFDTSETGWYPWRLTLDDAGTYYLNGPTPDVGEPTQLIDVNKNPLPYPSWLDGHGKKYVSGTKKKLEFDILKRDDLSALFASIET